MSTVSFQPNKKRGAENHSTGGSTNLGTGVSGPARMCRQILLPQNKRESMDLEGELHQLTPKSSTSSVVLEEILKLSVCPSLLIYKWRLQH